MLAIPNNTLIKQFYLRLLNTPKHTWLGKMHNGKVLLEVSELILRVKLLLKISVPHCYQVILQNRDVKYQDILIEQSLNHIKVVQTPCIIYYLRVNCHITTVQHFILFYFKKLFFVFEVPIIPILYWYWLHQLLTTQGVVTLIRPVEPSMTRIKMESSDQGVLQISNTLSVPTGASSLEGDFKAEHTFQ